MDTENIARIAALKRYLPHQLPGQSPRDGRRIVPGKVLLTQGIVSLPAGVVEVITAKVRGFTDFSEENDPRGEHDFGSFKQDGANIYWNGSPQRSGVCSDRLAYGLSSR